MTVAVQDFPRAFGVHFKDLLSYWEVRSVRISITNHCEWETVRLGDVCRVRFDAIPEEELLSGDIKLLDRISFDEGKVFAGKRTTTKMTQYRAKPGDIVVSKINARKRAIGIVPEGSDIGITIHFRALIPDTEKFDTQFLWLALRNPYCTNQFEIETGGIGKGEISEAKLLDIRVPFPPLGIQKKIVAVWKQAQSQIVKAKLRIEQAEKETENGILEDLGLRSPDEVPRAKAFASRWRDINWWGVNANLLTHIIDLSVGHYPVVRLGDIVEDLQNGWSPKCLKRPARDGEWGVLKLGAVSFGVFDPCANKALPQNIKPRKDLEVRKGDVLISRSNTLSLVGASAYVDVDVQKLMLPDLIFRVVWKSETTVRGDYLARILQTSVLRMQIEAVAHGTSPTMKKVTKPALLNLKIPLPPLDKQVEIMHRVGDRYQQIRREREIVALIAEDAERKVERMILGLEKDDFTN